MSLQVGGVVWAKMKGYSFWPSVISKESRTGRFLKGKGTLTKILVKFLGGEWDPTWVLKSNVKKFERKDTGVLRGRIFRVGKRWEKQHSEAMKAGLEIILSKAGQNGAKNKLGLENFPELFTFPKPMLKLSKTQAGIPKPMLKLSKTQAGKEEKISFLKTLHDPTLRRSRRQSCKAPIRDEPDLVSSVQYDSDWKEPYKCKYCLTRFGWVPDRDSHEINCEGGVAYSRLEKSEAKDQPSVTELSRLDEDTDERNVDECVGTIEENDNLSKESVDKRSMAKTGYKRKANLMDEEKGGNVYSEYQVTKTKYDMIKGKRRQATITNDSAVPTLNILDTKNCSSLTTKKCETLGRKYLEKVDKKSSTESLSNTTGFYENANKKSLNDSLLVTERMDIGKNLNKETLVDKCVVSRQNRNNDNIVSQVDTCGSQLDEVIEEIQRNERVAMIFKNVSISVTTTEANGNILVSEARFPHVDVRY